MGRLDTADKTSVSGKQTLGEDKPLIQKGGADTMGFNPTAIRVSGLPDNIDEDILELFFADTNRQGGGNVKKVVLNKQENIAVIYFEESEAVLRVLTKQPISLFGKELDISIIYGDKAKSFNQAAVKLTGLPYDIDEEMLQMICEIKGGKVKNVTLNKQKHMAVIDLEEPEGFGDDFVRYLPTTIKVEGLPDGVDENMLNMFFRNTKRQGGGQIKGITLNRRTKIAVIDFTDPAVVFRVLAKQPISWLGKELVISPCKDKTWQRFVNEVSTTNVFLNEVKIPVGNVFQQICKLAGRQSKIVEEICDCVCSYLRGLSDQIVEVWPAYEYSMKLSKTYGDQIVFVVVTRNGDVNLSCDYLIYQRAENSCSMESETNNKTELLYDLESKLRDDDLENAIKCINKHAKPLMDAHTNITMVSASSIKSVGFGTEEAKIHIEPSIVLYTHIKGMIPISESPFPKEIDGILVDVREAVFILSNGGPKEFHSSIKMGCAIRNAIINQSSGECVYGTLGGFLDHPQHGLCCFTCAHVLVPQLQMLPPQCDGTRKWKDNSQQVPVFQPISPVSTPFGRMVEAVFDIGDINEAGIDVALIKIETRGPVDGNFPYSQTFVENGFSRSNPMQFNTGKIYKMSEVKRNAVVFKYGATTEVTRGVFRLQGAGVSRTRVQKDLPQLNFVLLNQIEILSVGDQTFSAGGDSGAVVFVEDNNELVAIGMIEGHLTDKRSIVTPISEILSAIGMPPGSQLKRF